MSTRLGLMLVGLVSFVLAACSSIPTATDIPASIANASTPADHQRIADYFAQKAQAYDGEAALHRKMALSYISRPKSEPASMMAHCRALEAQFLSAAREVRALEEAHRQLARVTGQ